jgi:hypothetical protein
MKTETSVAGPLGQALLAAALLWASACQPATEAGWTQAKALLGPTASPDEVALAVSIVGDSIRRFVVGVDNAALTENVAPGQMLMAWRVGVGPLKKPEGRFFFHTPRAVLAADGRLHVIWGEPDTTAGSIPLASWARLGVSTLWSSSYDEHGWSRPTVIFRGGVTWLDATVTQFQGRKVDALVAVPRTNGGVLVLALEHGTWSTSIAADGVPTAYVSALSRPDDDLLAVVAADRTQRSDVNSVFLYARKAGGDWRLQQQVQRSGDRPAMEVSLVDDGPSRLHMVWRQSLRENHFVVRHVQSNDGGTTWGAPTDLTPGGVLQKVRAAVDVAGTLHVAFEDWTQGTDSIRLGHATFGGAWSRPERLVPNYVAGDPTLLRQGNGTLLLAFLRSLGTAKDGRPMMQSLFTEYR